MRCNLACNALQQQLMSDEKSEPDRVVAQELSPPAGFLPWQKPMRIEFHAEGAPPNLLRRHDGGAGSREGIEDDRPAPGAVTHRVSDSLRRRVALHGAAMSASSRRVNRLAFRSQIGLPTQFRSELLRHVWSIAFERAY